MLASSRVGRLFAVLTIEIFGFSTYKDLPDVLSLIYSAQLSELQQWLKKNSQFLLSNHFQTMSMLKGVVRVAGLIDSLVSDYQAIFSTSGSPQTKLPEFLQRFKETLQSRRRYRPQRPRSPGAKVGEGKIRCNQSFILG
jgi:hypothetical protein